MKAKCIKFCKFGIPQDVLKVENKTIEDPKDGEVLVRMITRPINPSDLIPISGAYAHRTSLPMIPGYEGVGLIEEVGPFVSRQLVGKRVLALRGEGTWQEYVKTSAAFAVPIPDSMEIHLAAQSYINPLTAWLACQEVLALKPEDVVLVNACGSSIGRIFAQLSKIIGFQLIAVTRSDIYTEELLRLGASFVINTAVMSLHETVMELTKGVGATAAIDSVGGSSGTELAFCVRPNGICLSIGLLSGAQVNWADITSKAKVNVKMLHLRHWNQQVSVQTWQKTLSHLISLIVDKKLTLMKPASHFNLLDIKEAVRVASSFENNQGKFFLTSGNG